MRFIEVKEDPRKMPFKTERAKHCGELIDALDRFLTTRYKYAKLDLDTKEYINTNSCYSSLNRVIKREHMPIQVVMRDGELYLVRTDI